MIALVVCAGGSKRVREHWGVRSVSGTVDVSTRAKERYVFENKESWKFER